MRRNLIRRGLPASCVLLLAAATVGCETFGRGGGRSNYDVPAYRPTDPSAVRVKVSLSNAAVYVMEGDRPLLVTATCVGRPETPTPTGHFRAFNRLPRKRSNTYGFHLMRDGSIVPGKRVNTPRGARYVGYPMPNWVEFKPGYGFHTGYVHPVPRSHGCLRLHKNVAPKFFALVPAGTPIHIAHSQPEDRTVGRHIGRPTDYTDPDPPNSYTVTQRYFDDLEPTKPLFVN